MDMIYRNGRERFKKGAVLVSLTVMICGLNLSRAERQLSHDPENPEQNSAGTEILIMIPVQYDQEEANQNNFLFTDESEKETGFGTALSMILNKQDGKADSEPAERDSDLRPFRIKGPEKMRAGSKKYFKPLFDEEKPRRYKTSWYLNCDKKVAQVFRNGQVWVKPKAKSGTILKLTCRVEGKDADGLPWTGEASMEIMIK